MSKVYTLSNLDAKTIGSMLKELRIGLDMTQEQLSILTGIQRPNICRIEQGRHVPSLSTLQRIVAAMGYRLAVSVG